MNSLKDFNGCFPFTRWEFEYIRNGVAYWIACFPKQAAVICGNSSGTVEDTLITGRVRLVNQEQA